MQNKIRATYKNGVFVPILNGDNLDLPEDTTVEITLEKVEQKEAEKLPDISTDDEKVMFESQLEWLKKHRDEYDGQYVALDGNVLVGYGATIREAHEMAKQKRVKEPFLTKVFSEETVVSGGL